MGYTKQQLLQCRCPAASESIRYRPFIVLAPACRKPQVSAVSDDGRWLIYSERPPYGPIMLVDLETRRAQPLNLEPGRTRGIRFVTSTLLSVGLPWQDLTRPYGLYDTTTNRLTPLPTVDLWKAPLTEELQALLRRATIVRVTLNHIVVLIGNPNTFSDESVVIDAGDDGRLTELRTQLDELQIAYSVDPIFNRPSVGPDAITSQDGRLSASKDGIARSGTGTLLVAIPPRWSRLNPPWMAGRWVLQDRAVLYGRRQTTIAGVGMWAAVAEDWLVVPQPLLLLPVPSGSERAPPTTP